MELTTLLFTCLLLAIGMGLAVVTGVLLSPQLRLQAVLSTSSLFQLSSLDTEYLKSFTYTLSEILKRVLLVLPGLLVVLLVLLFGPVTLPSVSLSFIGINIAKALAMIVPLLIGVAYLTLLERKVMASMQRRKGPNVVGLYGLLQPLADGLKLFLKESIIPSGAHKGIFILSPILTFFLAVMG